MLNNVVSAVCASLFLCMLSGVSDAACKYSFNKEQTKLTWIGYKTNEKVAVKGSFAKVDFTYDDKASTLGKLIESVEFKVDTTSLESGDKARDLNLKNLIFNLASSLKSAAVLKSISGKVKDFKAKERTATAEIKMNGQAITKKFKIAKAKNALTFTTIIDLEKDFKMDANVQALAKACKVLHKGKTWPEVAIEIKTTYKKQC